jgi:hypothetical protein
LKIPKGQSESVRIRVPKPTFNNISVILVEETGVPGEITNYHMPVLRLTNYHMPVLLLTNYHISVLLLTNYHMPVLRLTNYHMPVLLLTYMIACL